MKQTITLNELADVLSINPMKTFYLVGDMLKTLDSNTEKIPEFFVVDNPLKVFPFSYVLTLKGLQRVKDTTSDIKYQMLISEYLNQIENTSKKAEQEDIPFLENSTTRVYSHKKFGVLTVIRKPNSSFLWFEARTICKLLKLQPFKKNLQTYVHKRDRVNTVNAEAGLLINTKGVHDLMGVSPVYAETIREIVDWLVQIIDAENKIDDEADSIEGSTPITNSDLEEIYSDDEKIILQNQMDLASMLTSATGERELICKKITDRTNLFLYGKGERSHGTN